MQNKKSFTPTMLGQWPILGLTIILGLASCSAPIAITTPPVTVSLTSKGRSLPEKQFVPVELRTFADVAAGKRVSLEDISGVSCQLTSQYFNTNVVTPSRILVPVVDGGPAPFRAKCRWNEKTEFRSNNCYYGAGEQGAVVNKNGACLRNDLSVIFYQN